MRVTRVGHKLFLPLSLIKCSIGANNQKKPKKYNKKGEQKKRPSFINILATCRP